MGALDTEQAQRFLAAAHEDYARRVLWYGRLMRDEAVDVDELREARADVLAAQQVLRLARYEVEHAQEPEPEQRQA